MDVEVPELRNPIWILSEQGRGKQKPPDTILCVPDLGKVTVRLFLCAARRWRGLLTDDAMSLKHETSAQWLWREERRGGWLEHMRDSIPCRSRDGLTGLDFVRWVCKNTSGSDLELTPHMQPTMEVVGFFCTVRSTCEDPEGYKVLGVSLSRKRRCQDRWRMTCLAWIRPVDCSMGGTPRKPSAFGLSCPPTMKADVLCQMHSMHCRPAMPP